MEYVRCDLCGADHSLPLLERKDRFSGKTFCYVRCHSCGLIYLNPRPDSEEILSYYPAGYEAYLPIQTLSVVERWQKKRALRMLSRFVSQYQSSGRLLDVGCGTGDFLKEMQNLGWEVQGVEPDSQSVATARKIYGLDVFAGPLSTFQAPEEVFDVVTMWDVLEHLPSPKSALQQIYRWLRNNGYLIFSIPNLQSFDANLFGTYWIGWDAPRHLYLFPISTLINLLNTIGFNIITQCCFTGGQGSFWLSLHFLIKEKIVGEKSRMSLFDGRNWMLRLPLSIIIWPYKEISYLFNRGPILTVVARKAGKNDKSQN